MEIVLSDPKSGKAFSKKTETMEMFFNKRIGEEVSLNAIGLEGYTAKITGGSDAQGFPMKKDLEGSIRKSVFVVTHPKRGVRERITARGNRVAADVRQINMVVIKEGKAPLNTLLPKSEKKDELSAKEKVMEEIKKEQVKSGLKDTSSEDPVQKGKTGKKETANKEPHPEPGKKTEQKE